MTALDEQMGGNHYKKYPIQPWVFCETNRLTGAQTAVIDYVVRHADKGGLLDLQKAKHHIDLMIEHYYPTQVVASWEDSHEKDTNLNQDNMKNDPGAIVCCHDCITTHWINYNCNCKCNCHEENKDE